MAEMIRSDWDAYYDLVAGRPPREFLYRIQKQFDQPGFAVDLGCGAGQETVLLLLQGWRVLALDQAESALVRLKAQVTHALEPSLETGIANFESLSLPPADLIWAGLSLPFCPPEAFPELLRTIVSAVKPGGRFAGDFFGPRHDWADRPEMMFHNKQDVLALFQGMYVEYLIEEEGEMQTASSGTRHWHQFTVCARKTDSA